MISLEKAIEVLHEYRSDLEPNGYWIVDGRFVLRTKFTGEFNAGYYIIDGNTVIGTNPLRTKLDPKKMRSL